MSDGNTVRETYKYDFHPVLTGLKRFSLHLILVFSRQNPVLDK